ncbi:protein PRY1-like isoform X2 [Zootermopsis nevadensis]|uniref:protein PRY1-like isoform X2 n=1 Tax=Zootermopsis nevadensis TaxID=136037 RepID=UPI000B8E587D|nr:protein PRY1-like isoform X2 [Zootermopsis nevadensis]
MNGRVRSTDTNRYHNPPSKCTSLASRWRALPTAAIMDLNRIPSTTHGHEFHTGLSRVVMVRKTEQRTFASGKNGEEPKFETVTRETVETYRGNRPDRVTTSEKRDVFQNLPEDFRVILQKEQNGITNNVIRNGVVKDKPKSRSPSLSPDRSTTVKQKSEGRFSLTKIKSKPDNDTTGTEGDFAVDCLKAHNEYREKHGVPPLKLNKKLCRYSKEWAERLTSRGHLEHRQNSDCGENIFCSWSSNPSHHVTGREPVDNWYSEIKNHPFGREPNSLKSGHFSQVVWRDSKELGVAFAKSRSGQIFVVANYSPPGNFIGSFAENVPPLGGFVTSSQSKNDITKKMSPGNISDDDANCIEDEFAEEGVRIHNEYRRKHGVPDLKLSKSLCSYAKEWAKILAREDRFGHRPDGKYGENIYCMWSSDPQQRVTAKDACQSWYREIKDFAFGSEPRVLKSGHFTQMIWKNSQELGMGLARSKNGRVLIVANYNPRGNYIGQFAVNVPRPR